MPLAAPVASIPGNHKEHQMKSFRAVLVPVAAVALAVAAGTAFAAAPKPKTVTFKGTYSGQVTEKVDGTNVSALVNGTGVSTAVGKGKLLGATSGSTANPPCSPIAGTGSLTGPKGNLKMALLPTSRGCAASADDQNNISVSGNAKVTGGTRTFRKAKGTVHFSGTYDRSGGAFKVTFTGKLTY